MSAAPELKATLTLPQTAFPMKANLPQNEPLRLARWAELRIYDELRKSGQGRPSYILHDGPPDVYKRQLSVRINAWRVQLAKP